MCARILVLGSGGREHALAWRLSRDPDAPEVVVAPGNDGMAQHFRCVDVRETEPAQVVELARREQASLVVVGPEAPLAAGVADALAAAGIAVFGATAAAARIESSKWFAKEVMAEAQVPTPAALTFTSAGAAVAALARTGPPWVVKADGLAAGKGVLVTADRGEAEAFLHMCIDGARFGTGGRRVLLETHVAGEEASVVAVCDGEDHVLLPAARDFKRAYAGDRGPNTGGMGGWAPTPAVTPALEREISARIVTPVLRALAQRGTPYRGALYAGLMLTASGPQVIEFNARFGDPETEVVLPRLQSDLAALLVAAGRGELERHPSLDVKPEACVGVALCSGGYPGHYEIGKPITGWNEAARMPSVELFHSGTGRDGNRLVTAGGRVFVVTATAPTIAEAAARAYAAADAVQFEGKHLRRDIGR
jgi:phosphoribosylamine--glycine ligase